MCVPGCQEAVSKRLSRRGFFQGTAVLAGAAALQAWPPPPAAARPASVTFTRVVDLTHTLDPDFPTYFGKPQIALKKLFSIEKEGFNLYEWTVNEHTGTHMDAPIHFSKNGKTADQIAVEDLVVPLAVLDLSAKADANADVQVTPRDIVDWEAKNGRLPEACCVAMNSGWDRHVATPKFRNADSAGTMHFPGFHPEAAEMLMRERSVVGIAVDTLSLDFGASKDFKTHYTWLPSGRWGLESVAGLAGVPAKGATLVVGGPKVRGATGGPSRVLALV